MDTCPHCGADLPPGAKACPECGSDEETGWSDQARYDHLDLPDEEFNHDEFVKREFGGSRPRSAKPAGLHWFWWGVAVLILGGFVFLFVRALVAH